MNDCMVQLLAEPAFVVGWYVVGGLGAGFVLRRQGVTSEYWSRRRWGWAVSVFFLSAVGWCAFGAWLAKRRRLPGSVRLQAHQVAMEWVASTGVGALLGVAVARAMALGPNQEWALAVAAGVAGAGILLATPLSSLGTRWARPRARDWSVAVLAPITASSWLFAYNVMGSWVAGEQPAALSPAFWGHFGSFALSSYGASLLAAWSLTRGGLLLETNSLNSTREVLSRHAGARRLSLMGATGVCAVVAIAWLAQRAAAGSDEPLGVTSAALLAAEVPEHHQLVRGLRRPHDGSRSVLEPSSRALLAALCEGLKVNVGAAKQGLLDRDRRAVSLRRLDAAQRAAAIGTYVAPNSAFSRAIHPIRQSRYALQWGDASWAQAELTATLRELSGKCRLATPRQSTSVLQAYRGALVLNTRGEPVGRVITVDNSSMKLGLVGSQREAMWRWLKHERVVEVHPGSLLLGPVRAFGATVVVPTMSPRLRRR